MSKGNLLFPIFLQLDKLKLLIVGGGNVGLEKVGLMFKHADNGDVKLVAPEIRDEIVKIASDFPNLKLIHKKFEQSDLDHIDIVIAATSDRKLNKQVYELAKQRGILVNVADTPELCDFYLSSVVKKGDLKIAISSNGKSPTLTKRMREILEDVLPEEVDELLQSLTEIRNSLKGDLGDKIKKLNEITSVMKTDKTNTK